MNKTESMEKNRRCLERMIRLMKKLPGETGPQINPQESILAMNILQKAVDRILEEGQKALRDL